MRMIKATLKRIRQEKDKERGFHVPSGDVIFCLKHVAFYGVKDKNYEFERNGQVLHNSKKPVCLLKNEERKCYL